MSRLYSIGELLIDFKSSAPDLKVANYFEKNPGGAPANVAVQVSLLGGEASFIGAVGNDVFGVYLKDIMNRNGVDTKNVYLDDVHSTPLAFVSIGENAERNFDFLRKNTADLYLNSKNIKLNFKKEDIFHFGTVALFSENNRQTHSTLIDVAKNKESIISFDPNIRLSLWEDHELLKNVFFDFVNKCDILKIADNELEFLYGHVDYESSIKDLLGKGPKLIILTKGKSGSILYLNKNDIIVQNAYDVECKDTTGAGDAFFGAFLYRVSKYKGSFKELISDIEYLTVSMDIASMASAYVVCGYGAISSMGTESQIKKVIKGEN